MKEVDDTLVIEDASAGIEIPEEQKPEEYRTRQKLMAELSEAERDSVLDEEFNASLRELNETMRELLLPTKNGWPILDQMRKDDLLRQYTRVGEKLEKFLKDGKPGKEEIAGKEEEKAGKEKGIRETAEKLSHILADDFRVLKAYDPRKKQSFLTVLEDGRTKEIRIDKKKAETMKGAISERIPIRMTRPDGKEIRGFFTSEDHFSLVEEFHKMGKAAAGSAKTQQGRIMLETFYRDYLNYYSKHLRENHQRAQNQDYNSAIEFLKNISEKEKGIYKISKKRLVKELAYIHDVTENDVVRLCGSNALNTLYEQGRVAMSVYSYCLNGGIREGARKDNRNSAMSTVADMLGISEIVCYAKPMKMIRDDGSVVKGTFMASAEGLDPCNPDPQYVEAIRNKNREKLLIGKDGTSLKKISELQALDYICGNMDRHAQNLFYKIDKNGNVTGIQGIDNDTSFGSAGKKARGKNVCKMVVPENMGAISKEMAERILKLQPEQLEFALRGQLGEDEIHGAVERLENMKEAILTGRKNIAGDDKGLKYPYLREVADNEWTRPDILEGLRDEKHNNLFRSIREGFPKITRVYDSLGYNAPKLSDAETNNRAEYTGLLGEIKTAGAFGKDLAKAVGKPGYATDDYRALQNAVEDYRKKMEAIRERIKASTIRIRKKKDYSPEAVTGRYISHSDLTTLTDAAKKIKEAARQYYNNAKAELNAKGGNAADVRRMKKMKEAVKAIHTHVSGLTTLSEGERKQLQQNQRRQTDDMVRIIRMQQQKPGDIKNSGKSHTVPKAGKGMHL